MPGSFKIATIRGIPVRIHFTMLLIFVLLAAELGPLGLPAGVFLFGSVLAHELGHAVVAQRYGIKIAGIQLHLLGGTALMQGVPAIPRQEIAIALAGPAVSLGLGLGFGLTAALINVPFNLVQPGLIELIPYLAVVNLAMAVFNLIPALPMDGGRVLRALLAMRMPALRATRAAAWIARVFAVAFIAGGLFVGAWTLPLIGLMVFVLAGYEQRLAEQTEAQRVMSFDPDPMQPLSGFRRWSAPRPPRVAPRVRRVVVISSRVSGG